MLTTPLFLLLLHFCVCIFSIDTTGSNETDSNSRIFFLKKCNGAGCPYTASWLAHINLYRKLPWWLDITKMEAASFNM